MQRKRERIGSGRTRGRVAVVRTRPETVLDDVAGLMRRMDYTRALPRYWWPVYGKRRMADIASTPWGRLFAAYE